MRQGLSQAKLATTLGCGREHIWRLEHGQRVPSRQLLFLLLRSCPLTETEKETTLDFARLEASFHQLPQNSETPGITVEADSESRQRAVYCMVP